jgi:hypothetical protein
MMRITRSLIGSTSCQLVLPIIGIGMLAGPARAAAPKVKDHAHLFPEAALTQAVEQLQEIKHNYRADVVIETFQEIPFHRDPWHKFKKMDPAARDAFFRNWAKGRVPGPDGIYVFIFQGPEATSIEVQLGRGVRAEREFTVADAEEVRDRIRAEMNAGHADRALGDALQFIRDRLDANLGGSIAPRPFDWPGMAAIIVPVVGLWLTLMLIQVFRGGEFRAPFAGVSTLGHGIGCNFATCLRAALAAPDAAPPAPVAPALDEHGEPDRRHEPKVAGYAEHIHGE